MWGEIEKFPLCHLIVIFLVPLAAARGMGGGGCENDESNIGLGRRTFGSRAGPVLHTATSPPPLD